MSGSYEAVAQVIKGMIDDGTLKPGKSVSLKQTALAAGLKPGSCVEDFKGVLGMWLDAALRDAGVKDVRFLQVGAGRYRRFVFKRLKPLP